MFQENQKFNRKKIVKKRMTLKQKKLKLLLTQLISRINKTGKLNRKTNFFH